jgi:hypothetical protein
MPRVIPSLDQLYKRIPWERTVSSESRAAALRTASLWQGREFLLLHVDATKPTHTVADGVVSAITVINASITEEILAGFFGYSEGVNLERSGLSALSIRALDHGLIGAATFGEIDDLRNARNEIAHADRSRTANVTSTPLDSKEVAARAHSRVPTKVARELRTARLQT